MLFILMIVLLLALLGAFPTGGYGFASRGSYSVQYVLGTVLMIVLIFWIVQYI